MKRMKKFLMLGIGVVALAGLAGCASYSPVVNTTDVRNVDFSKPMKKGEACYMYFFGSIGPFGDASIVNAAKDAGIAKVEVADYAVRWGGIVVSYCVVVHGN